MLSHWLHDHDTLHYDDATTAPNLGGNVELHSCTVAQWRDAVCSVARKSEHGFSWSCQHRASFEHRNSLASTADESRYFVVYVRSSVPCSPQTGDMRERWKAISVSPRCTPLFSVELQAMSNDKRRS